MQYGVLRDICLDKTEYIKMTNKDLNLHQKMITSKFLILTIQSLLIGDLQWRKEKLTNVATPKSTDTAVMNKIRNSSKMQHAILGAIIWDRLLPSFQLDIIYNWDKIKNGSKYDDIKLWHHINREVINLIITGTS